ncbi:6-pyruvoyl tetrahydropterin reductase [Reinekea thalattae]|uniref:6-carboxy-5,6,7,8-tetrahydropterin synthase n=2 Tax=Reinekea thalattae TaxID=2593301 RepID=A0A5C8Z473_9GAMM|nr:6-pyruvoyl tetrahydropterin reductase [Reinekea thalattae]
MNRLFVDNLTVLDFSYFHPKRGVVGESWIVDVELVGELNDEGMVFDFGHVKKLLKQALDNGMDHTLVVPTQLAGVEVIHHADSDMIEIRYHNSDNALAFAYQSPRDAVYLVDAEQVSIATALPLLQNHLNSLVPSNVKQVSLKLRAENIDAAFYHYSHGLKKHLGDCQRICHGHRSRVEIFRNGKRDFDVEQEWAQRFCDIYLITEDDLLPSEHQGLTHVGYDAEQGRFDVWLNPKQCYNMNSDTTVELIGSHICDQLKLESPNDHWLVRAFEGVQKGSIAER